MEKKNIARVILRSDGSIHIAFEDIRTIYATAENIMALFSNPMDFITTGSQSQIDSTAVANRNRVPLDNVLGLTLASVNSDKQIVCDFPELFQYIFSSEATDENRKKPLRMEDYENRMVLPDEKSFLLRYFLEFTRNLKSRVAIQKNIRLRNEVQIAIMREILNAYFEEELPKPSKPVDLSGQIDRSENELMYQPEKTDPMANMVTVDEYSKIVGLTPNTVRLYIREKKLIKVQKIGIRYYIDKDERPPKYDKRKGSRRKKTGEEKFFRRTLEGSPEEVRAYIQKNRLFSDEIGKYIRTYAEVDYYVKHSYHEVCWNGRYALILNVNPEYIVPDNMVQQKVKNKAKKEATEGYRNRDLMSAGFPPVVPEKHKDQYIYHIHHIGQRPESPFCIIPSFEHNSKELSSVFHLGSSGVELHTPEFEIQKNSFWKEYIRQYDNAGEYNKIPYNSPRKERYERNKAK